MMKQVQRIAVVSFFALITAPFVAQAQFEMPKAPEIKAPEIKAPEVKAPVVTAPEAPKAPDVANPTQMLKEKEAQAKAQAEIQKQKLEAEARAKAAAASTKAEPAASAATGAVPGPTAPGQKGGQARAALPGVDATNPPLLAAAPVVFSTSNT